MLERITFGITSFERPRLLEQLVASIRRRYPQARILVADNGRQKANLPEDVRVLDLEFDCGLSRARNAMIDNLETEFLLLLEEDFCLRTKRASNRLSRFSIPMRKSE
jgi:DNA-binding transcriptional LysR family regulator